MRAPPSRRPAALVIGAAALALAIACAAATALLIRFELDRVLFVAMPGPADGAEAFREAGPDGAAMTVRRSGRGDAGCVVYFPGRHGGAERHAGALFTRLRQAGLAVYAAAYPGQDGAPGRATLADVDAMAARIVARVIEQCGPTRTVVAGRSLGATVAAWAAGSNRPAGLVLESASPSLSAGVRAGLRGRWFTRPFAVLPVEHLVAPDRTLTDPLSMELHVVVFQGTADTQTPLAELWPDPSQPAYPPIVAVPGGSHSDTPLRAAPAMAATIVDMIRGARAERAAGYDDN